MGKPSLFGMNENSDLEKFSISNRRYLGSKTKILSNIESVIVSKLGRVPKSIFDAFAGSGVVGARFAELGSQSIFNDLLIHNAMAHHTFVLHQNYVMEVVKQHLKQMALLEPVDGYITDSFGNRYFSMENAMKLDAWREYIEKIEDDSSVKSALITCLIYAADKVAQTVGHYDAFFTSNKITRDVELRIPNPVGTGVGHIVLNKDANEVVPGFEVEVLYLDPPYNSRQYSDNYHVLENIARWEKPDVLGVSRKMDRSGLKSRFSSRQAETAFDELVLSARADLIVLSYSNTGTSRVSRSNNVLSDDHILKVLRNKGRVTIENIDFKEFSVGKTSHRNHQERLFICEAT